MKPLIFSTFVGHFFLLDRDPGFRIRIRIHRSNTNPDPKLWFLFYRSETDPQPHIRKQFTNRAICLGKDAVELEVTLDGEGKDRVFRVSMKWHAQV
jgi:hypothetical protein